MLNPFHAEHGRAEFQLEHQTRANEPPKAAPGSSPDKAGLRNAPPSRKVLTFSAAARLPTRDTTSSGHLKAGPAPVATLTEVPDQASPGAVEGISAVEARAEASGGQAGERETREWPDGAAAENGGCTYHGMPGTMNTCATKVQPKYI